MNDDDAALWAELVDDLGRSIGRDGRVIGRPIFDDVQSGGSER